MAALQADNNKAAHPKQEESEGLVQALEHLVGLNGSQDHANAPTHAQAGKSPTLSQLPSDHNAITPAPLSTASHNRHWWSRFLPSESRVDELFAEEHMGNYVVLRNSRKEVFESMPIYVRVGMQLLFFHSQQFSLLRYDTVERLLQEVSVHQGSVYDDASDPQAVLEHIQSFVQTYSIPLQELLEPDLQRYPTFNSFFSRKLRPGVRPIADPSDPSIISSCADCRLTVFPNVTAATKVWIKGKKFSLPALLDDVHTANSSFPPGSSLAIFRLAPADYHRYHAPVGPSVAGPTKHIQGTYLTVNPQAVNQDFDVFTGNRRDVWYSTWHTGSASIPFAFVAIGALLVGSIAWSAPATVQGATYNRGDEVGYFAYGGSTVVVVFPPQANVQWDQDIVEASYNGKEVMVRMGERIGKANV
ncbi:unnamed protein product [Sympodiomycopsis kandeliae]